MLNNKILIDRPFFEHLLNCLANQKYIHELPNCGDGLSLDGETVQEIREWNQQVIDDAWNDGMGILLGKSFVPKTKFLRDLWETPQWG